VTIAAEDIFGLLSRQSVLAPRGLHPDVRAVLAELNAQTPLSYPYDVNQMRQRASRQLAFAAPTDATVSVERVATSRRDVPLRIYIPDNDAGRAAILYFHGGGWVTGTLDLYDAQLRLLAKASRAVVIGVGYRPAPEQRHPGADLDADDAYDWACKRYGAHRAIIVAGDSSGGHIAATLTYGAVLRGPAPAMQVLIYPILDREMDSWSFRQFGEGGILGSALMQWYWDQYLQPGQIPDDESLSPLRVPDLSAQPPTLLIAAGHDVLLAQNRAFAARLALAGIPVRYLEHPDMIHGYLRWTGRVSQSLRTIQDIADEIERRTSHGR